MNKKVILPVIAVLIIGAVFYFRSPDLDIPGNVLFKTIQQDLHGGFDVSRNVVAISDKEWLPIWNQVSSGVTPKPTAPEIDFSKEMVIATFMGTKASGGFSTEITRVVNSDEKVVVYVNEVSPGENCRVTFALSAPYHVIKVPKTEKVIEFSVTHKITDCALPELE
jgi:hypothetical protein